MGTLSCISGRARGVDECVRMILLIVITLLGGAGAAVYFLGLDQVLQLLGVKPLTKQELSDYKNPLIKKQHSDKTKLEEDTSKDIVDQESEKHESSSSENENTPDKTASPVIDTTSKT